MAWCRSGDKPLSGPTIISLLTNICVIWPQWVNSILTCTIICPMPATKIWPQHVLSDSRIWHGCQPNDDAVLNQWIKVIRNIPGVLWRKSVSRAETSNYMNKLLSNTYISRSPWLRVVSFKCFVIIFQINGLMAIRFANGICSTPYVDKKEKTLRTDSRHRASNIAIIWSNAIH